METLLLAKSIFKKAKAMYDPSDNTSLGITVSLLQDSAEMLVWFMAKHFNIDLRVRDGFVSIVNNIDSNHGGIDLKAQIFELNNARVNFKHYGNIPSLSDMPKFIRSCESFLVANSRKIDFDFQELSCSDAIQNQEIKELLKQSEQYIEAEEFRDAMIQSSLAFQALVKIANKSLDVGLYDIEMIEDAYQLFPDEKQREAQEFTSNLANLLKNMVNHHTLGKLDSFDFASTVQNMCYRVLKNERGNIVDVYVASRVEPNKERVLFINEFIIDSCRRLSI